MIGSLPSVAMVEQMGGIGALLEDELELARNLDPATRVAILVEGESDRRAVEALAKRLGRDLTDEGVVVIAITGATNVGRFIDIVGPQGRSLTLAGMCDEGEEGEFAAALATAGLGSEFDRNGMEAIGFFVCVIDLEDELIKALGVERMLEVIDEQDESRAFQSFQNQPDQRHKTVEQQMWRWLGNRKIRYAKVLVDALDLDRVPEPLMGVLEAIDRSLR